MIPTLRRFRVLARGTALLASLAVFPVAAGQTVPTGGDQPFDNTQPSLALHTYVPLGGTLPSPSGASATGLGMLRTVAGTYVPFGDPAAQGQLLSIQAAPALFDLLGTTWGGDGITTFGLPDLRGRTAIGAGGSYALGAEAGRGPTTLAADQLPPHVHALASGTTGSAGASVPIDNRQPSTALNWLIRIDGGVFPSHGSGPISADLLGQVVPYLGGTVPQGFAQADGRLIDVQTHTPLFSVIGTLYGGDGQHTFALPDLRGRAVVGAGTSSGPFSWRVGEVHGSDATFLTSNQMPIHEHGLPGSGDVTGPAGQGQPFDNTQPSIALTWLVNVGGSFPSQNCCNANPEASLLGEVMAFAGEYAPPGWMQASGQLLPISQYQALFFLLGTTYGGDGRTTFALPDLRGRAVVGAGEGWSLGDAGGSPLVTLTTAQLPAHAHALPVPEPGAYALMVAGLGALAWRVRLGRRRT